MLNLGNIELGGLIVIPFNTFDANGASVTVTNLADTDVHIHRDGNAAQFTNPSAVTVFIDFDGITGNHLIIIDTDVSSAVADFQEGSDFQIRLEGITVATQTLNVWIAVFSIVNRAGDITHVNGDQTGAANLKLQYNGTGLSGDTFPATQSQLNQIALTGAAVSTPAKDSPNGFTIAFGENEANDEDSTHAADGTYHDIEAQDDGGTEKIDVYYEFAVGGDGIPTSVSWEGYLNKGGGVSKNITVQAYNWGTTSWDQIGSIVSGTSDVNETFTLFTSHVGTGANIGLVRIKFVTGTVAFSSTTLLKTDQIFVSYAIIARTVGYADGAIWVNTVSGAAGTESFVNGTADNPVDTWADALTLSGNLNITRFHIINGSTVTLSANSDNYTLIGDGWTLALGGQSVAGAHFAGADVTGTGTGATHPRFSHCHFGAVTLPPSDCEGCILEGTVTVGSAGNFFFEACQSGIAGTSTPVFDFGGALNSSDVNFRDYSGGIEIQNMGAGSGSYNMSLEGFGQLIINANCSATAAVSIRGHFTVSGDGTAIAAISFSDEAMFDHNSLLDTLQTAGYSDGAVWIDTNASNTNTVSYVDGVADNPVSTIAAATTIAGNLNLKRFHLVAGSSITLAQAYNFCTFIGYGATIALGGQSINGAVFVGSKINGNDDGSNSNRVRYFECDIDGSTLGQFIACRCRLTGGGDLNLAEAGTYFLDACYSGVAGTSTPALDFGSGLNASNVSMRHYSGGIEIKNMGKGTGNYNMSLEGEGQLVINANCTADGGGVSTVAIRGNFTVTDNASGAVTLSDDARIDVDQINAEVDTALSDYGPNTVVPDAAGVAAGLHSTTDALINALNNLSAAQVNTECDTALSDYNGPTKAEMDTAHAATDALINAVGALVVALNDPTVAEIRTEMEVNGGKLDHLWEMTEDDGGVRRYTANALEEAPSGAGLTGTQNTALILIKDIMEGDVTIDMTTTPWQLVVKLKNTATEKLRKDLKDVNGVDIAATSTIIGQVLEP